MCGIFGLIRNTDAPHPERASAVFVELGHLAVERGSDSAGFALLNPDPTRPVGQVSPALTKHAEGWDFTLDDVRIIKDILPFHRLWDDAYHLPLLAANRVALGHTRWATQGKRDSLTNASPLTVGNLVGTHNGDIDTASVPGKAYLPRPIGSTDTEWLYQALDRDRRDRRKVTDTLKSIEGRAALAWIDRARPDRVYLSRAALSPLALAWDAEGNLYWASNPRWFRDIDTKFNNTIGFHDILIVQEGTLLTVSLNGAAPDIEDARRFIPRCRPSDARLSDGIVWRGFDTADCAADKAQTRHKVAARRPTYGSYATWNDKPAKASNTARKSGLSAGGETSSWDMTKPGYFSTPALAAGSTGRDLPVYDDGLDAISSREFASTDSDGWGDDIADTADEPEIMVLDEEEAMQAAVRWMDDGGDDAILGALRSAAMPSEIESLMVEFDLPSIGSFHKFRDIVESWTQTIRT